MCCYPKLKNDLDASRTEAAKWFNVSQNEKSEKRKLSRANTLLPLKRENTALKTQLSGKRSSSSRITPFPGTKL
jgi:hypothetical protein